MDNPRGAHRVSKTHFDLVTAAIEIQTEASWNAVVEAVKLALRKERHFRRRESGSDFIRVGHQMGWGFVLRRWRA